MATITQSIADTSGFVPQTWALEALNVLRRNLVLTKLITMDADINEVGWIGKTLNIPYPGTFTAVDKVAGTAVTAQAPVGGATVSLALSKHKVTDFLVEDYAAAQSNADLLMRYINPAVVSIAEQIESDLWGMMTSITGPSVGTVNTNLNAATFFNARKQLNIQKAPQTDRFAVVSTKDEVALLQDSTLQYYFAANQNAEDAFVNGASSKPFAGFNIHMSQFADNNADYHGVQTITITGTPTGGTFTVTYQGQTTTAIAYNASAATVQAALLALSTIPSGVTCSGGALPGSAVTVTFGAGIPGAPVAFTANGASLTGGASPAVVIADSTTLTTHNLFLHKSAMMMAMRQFAPIPPGSGVAMATVVDTESGIAIRVLKQYSPQYRAEYVGFDVLYGFVALRPGLGVVALS